MSPAAVPALQCRPGVASSRAPPENRWLPPWTARSAPRKRARADGTLALEKQGTGEFSMSRRPRKRRTRRRSRWSSRGRDGVATPGIWRYSDSGFSVPAVSVTVRWRLGSRVAMLSPQIANLKMHWADKNCCFLYAHAHWFKV
ncbi:hypothetical protein I79_016571 [Cricetulus griseus]|uniref:Uncharacterized protein n=1 Tax=Cricetulus griseus TaxID=10029 RepID=G3HZR2_CRIGR|nr:hypothetical protein I79_016571 [Cricetulus griseus]